MSTTGTLGDTCTVLVARPQTNKYMEHEDANIRDWRNEHGQPDFAYLDALVVDGSIQALEKLRSIAEDLDVEYDPNIPPRELIGRIRTMVTQNGDVGAQPTT